MYIYCIFNASLIMCLNCNVILTIFYENEMVVKCFKLTLFHSVNNRVLLPRIDNFGFLMKVKLYNSTMLPHM